VCLLRKQRRRGRDVRGVYDIGPTGYDPADAIKGSVLRVSCARAERLIRAYTGALVRQGRREIKIGRWKCNVRKPILCMSPGGRRVRWRFGSIHPPCEHPLHDAAQVRLQRVSCGTARELIRAHTEQDRVCWSWAPRRTLRCTLVVNNSTFECESTYYAREDIMDQICRASEGKEVAWGEFL
jgi:hypothetical protein